MISVLLVIVGILTFLSGIVVLFGSKKPYRAASVWYFVATTFSTTWLTAIAFFLTAKADNASFAPFLLNTGFVSALLLDVGFLGYTSWEKKSDKAITLFFLAAALIISAVIVFNPGLMYSDVTISNTGNSANLIIGPLYFVYIGYFSLIIPAILYSFFRQYRHARSKKKRIGGIVILCAFGLSNIIILITNLIMPMPFINDWSMTWLGPLTLAIITLSIYYMILHYKAVTLSYTWLRIFSYIIVIASIAITYIIIFSIVFAALFRGSTPSLEVIILNFIMILIFIALIPAMSGFMRSIHRSILEQHPSREQKTDEKSSKEKS